MLLGLEKSKRHIEIYNVGSENQIDVKTIAQIVIEEMGLNNVKLTFTGGVDGGRGCKGDVKNMLLNISKLKSLGWKPKLNSQQTKTKTVRHPITELKPPPNSHQHILPCMASSSSRVDKPSFHAKHFNDFFK